MYQYLPSKKFILIFLSVILALGLVYTPSFLKNRQLKKTIPVEVTTATVGQKLPNLDSDNDGLKDWEETLHGTDAYKPDSDGDGTNDSIEINEKRDPLIANTANKDQEPTDKLTEEIINALKEGVEDFEGLSTTDKISRELILQYINSGKNATELTEAEKEAMIDKAFSYLPEFTFKTYARKDILSTSAKDPESLRIYANNVAKVILDNLSTKTESIETIITDAGEIESDTALNEEIEIVFQRFDPLIEKNKKSISDLLKITVPEIFIQEHLLLLNSFEEIYGKLDLMQKSADDFIIVIVLRRGYYVSVEKLALSLQKMTESLITSKVTFSTEKDYGYELFNVIMSLP